MKENLIVAITGASGALATKLLIEKSSIPVTLVASRMGQVVYEQEVGPFKELSELAAEVYEEHDMMASIASGSVLTAGMVLLPCSVNTLGKVASGISDSLITRAVHCQLKEGRKVVFCVRESPWTAINTQNAATVASAGGVIMPVSPPYYMVKDRSPEEVTMTELLSHYVEHVLSLFGQKASSTWEDVK